MLFACPHCGWRYSAIVENARRRNKTAFELVPYHDWPKPTRQVCPGACRPPVRVNECTHAEESSMAVRVVTGAISSIQYIRPSDSVRVVLADSQHLEYRVTGKAKIKIDGQAGCEPSYLKSWIALGSAGDKLPFAELTIDGNERVTVAAFDYRPAAAQPG